MRDRKPNNVAGFFRAEAKSLAMNSGAVARRVAVAAMIIALSLVTSLLPSLPGPITKFQGLPLMLGGLLIGARTGFAVGCITDLIGFVLRPTGFFFPGFTLTQALTASLPGLMSSGRDPLTWKKLDEDSEPATSFSYLRILGIFGVTQLLTSVLMVSYFTSEFVRGTPLELELTTRAIAQAMHVPVYAFLALAILRALAETDLYRRLLKSRR